MSSLGSLLPLSLGGSNVHLLEDMRKRRRTSPPPHKTASASVNDPDPRPTVIKRDDATIARITVMVERFAHVGRLPDASDPLDGMGLNLDDREPDAFSEGALAMLRFLKGQLDETSLLMNWATENGLVE